MQDFQLSPHFSFYELTTTDHRDYLEKNREVINDRVLMANGHAVAAVLLEPIRVYFNKPVIVHSGYRCPELNSLIKGSTTSQHKVFQACDFHVNGIPLEDVFYWVWKKSNIPFGQLIQEGVVAGNPTWIHISLGSPWFSKNGEVLTWDKASGYKKLQ